ncbi:esterase/lipase family protein [Nocardia gipuzkoensis]
MDKLIALKSRGWGGASVVSVVTVSGSLRSLDAVVVLPGILGSELVDEQGVVRWGLKPAVLAKALAQQRMESLHVTDEDAAGGGRLHASRLLRVPGYAVGLGGVEPYTTLLAAVSRVVVDPRAVLEFPYDWRLSIDVSARKLAERCARHLEVWRAVVAQERYGDPEPVRVVVVAHSMGGLITRYAMTVHGLSELVDTVITLGTPYYGAVRAMQMLATGESPLPVPKAAAQALARTCPGVYDLLPRYRCVEDGGDLRRLTPEDVADAGGSARLAADANERWKRLRLDGSDDCLAGALRSSHAVAGAFQPTLQGMRIRFGACEFSSQLSEVDHGGDSTVYRRSATPTGVVGFVLPQKHGALAKTGEALTFVTDKLLGGDTPPPLGTRPVGLDIPDLATAGEPVHIRVVVADGDPVGLAVQSVDLETGRTVRWQPGRGDEDGMVFTHSGLRPGLHRVEANAGGFSPVTDIMLVTAAS